MEISVDPVVGETALCFSTPTSPRKRPMNPSSADNWLDDTIEMPHIYREEEDEDVLEEDMSNPPLNPKIQYTDSDVALMSKFRERSLSKGSGGGGIGGGGGSVGKEMSPVNSFRSSDGAEVHRFNSADAQDVHVISPEPTKQRPPQESSSLLRTTANRKNDANSWAKKKQMKELKTVQSMKSKPIVPPSERLMKPTQARVCDIRYRERHKGEVEHKDDIWWEARKPYERVPCKYNGPSKLLQPTAAYLSSLRGKVMMGISGRKRSPTSASVSRSSSHAEGVGTGTRTSAGELPDCGASEEQHARSTPPKPAAAAAVPTRKAEPKVARIAADSSLLRTTKCSTVGAWGSTPPPRPPPQLNLATTGSGPKNVSSKLFEETVSARHQKYQPESERSPAVTKSPPLQLATANSKPSKKVSSKLFSETATFRNGKYQPKSPTTSEEQQREVESPPPRPATAANLGPKNVQSKLFQETAASIAQRAGHTVSAPPPMHLELVASSSGPHVPSKLFEDTAATRRSRYGYHDEAKEQAEREAAAAAEKLQLAGATSGPKQVNSKLYEDTATSRGWRYRNADASKEAAEVQQLQLVGARSGPQNVSSKLYQDTANSRHARFVPKENLPPPPPLEVFKLDLPGTLSGPQNVTSRLNNETTAAKMAKYNKQVKQLSRTASDENPIIATAATAAEATAATTIEEPYLEF